MGVSIAHRLLATPYIGEGFGLSPIHLAKSLLIGTASDFWISVLAACLLLVVGGVTAFSCGTKLGQAAILALGMILVIFVALHQPYVEFFRVPIIPFHLDYFGDADFVTANYASVLNIRAALLLALGPAFLLLFNRIWDRVTRVGWVFLILILVGVTVHALQIKYRVQWFIPEPMRSHFLESLYTRWNQQIKTAPLTDDQMVALNLTSDSIADIKRTTMTNPFDHLAQHGSHPLLASLMQQVRIVRGHGQRPLFIVYLMESFRAADTGIYYPQGTTPTPAFDQFAKNGILFRKAWSTGTVTRGAQEALMCGFPGAMTTSTMRERTDVSIQCLPQKIEGFTFWYHAGKGAFDGQVAFWRRQGVQDILSAIDFAEETARTDWGFSDLALVQKASRRLARGIDSSHGSVDLGMLLTVTNHIPWRVPSDGSSVGFEPATAIAHPSHETARYADLALGKFIDELHSAELWDRTLLLVVGDHGIQAPSACHAAVSPEHQLTHVAMATGGGIVSSALARLDHSNLEVNDHVSQMDVAPFFAILADIQGMNFFGQPLLTPRTAPVWSNLGEKTFFPHLDLTVATNDILLDQVEESLQELTRLERAYVKSFRLALEGWHEPL